MSWLFCLEFALEGKRGCLAAALSGRICQLGSKHGASSSPSEDEDGGFRFYISFICSPVPLSRLYLGADHWISSHKQKQKAQMRSSAGVSELHLPQELCPGSGGLLLCQLGRSPQSWRQRFLYLKCCQCRPTERKS